jgi:hypothetical protein
VPRDFGPDLVGDRAGPIGEPGRGLGERQRGPLGVVEERVLVTTTPSTVAPPTPTSVPSRTRSSTGSASSGPPEAHIERLTKLRALGVDQFAVYLQRDDKERTLDAYRDEIIPAMRDR